MATQPGADGEADAGQTSSVQSSQSGTTLNQLKNEQAKLIQQLSRSDDADEDDGLLTPNGTTPENISSMASSVMTDSMTAVTPATILMPGLQPFGRGRTILPSSWSVCTLSGDTPFCLLMLHKQSLEFQSIVSEFTMVGLTIKQIQRIENRDLWERFEFEKTRMAKNRADVNEVYLYHGTTADKEQICQEGLDQRLSRIGFFGRGVYFSNDPRKCLPYTENEAKSLTFQKPTCAIYKCRVLLGNMKVYPPGKHDKDLKREPAIEKPEPGGLQYYDSVKGHVKEFDEFIIYKSERVMPEYIISCYLPQPSATIVEAAKTSLPDLRDGEMDKKLYEGIDVDELHAEIAAGAMHTSLKSAVTQSSGRDLEEFYDCMDEQEINMEIAAGGLKQTTEGPSRKASQKTEAESDEVSLEITAEVLKKPERNAFQQRVQKRVKDDAVDLAGAVRRAKSSSSLKNQQEEVTLEDQVHPETEVEEQVGSLKDNQFTLEHEGDVYEQLHQEEILAAIRARDRQEKREQQEMRGRKTRLKDHRSVTVNRLVDRKEEVITQGVSGSQRSTSLPKSGLTVNNIEEPRRYKKETIAPEFLPVVLEVREKVQKARLQEKRNPEQRSQFKSTEQQWADDGVKEVLDVLIVQFMDVTACEDIEEARECIMKANMDVNKAIISYING